jgi:hypothetical protein
VLNFLPWWKHLYPAEPPPIKMVTGQKTKRKLVAEINPVLPIAGQKFPYFRKCLELISVFKKDYIITLQLLAESLTMVCRNLVAKPCCRWESSHLQ